MFYYLGVLSLALALLFLVFLLGSSCLFVLTNEVYDKPIYF